MNNQVAKGALFLTLSSAVFIVTGYISNIWLGRYLGPNGYGVCGIVISLMTAANLILTSGLPQGVSKYISSNEKNAEKIFKNALIIQGISMIIITTAYFFSAPLLSLLFQDASLSSYIKLSALILPFYSIYSLSLGYYNGFHKFGMQALMNIIYSSVKLIAIISLTYYFYLQGTMIGFIIAPIIALSIPVIKNFKSIKSTINNFSVDKNLSKNLILFSLPIIGFATFSSLQQSVDLYFVKGILKSAQETGFYTASQNIAKIPFFALSAFSLVIFPSISKSITEKNNVKTKQIISQSLRLVFLLLLPTILMLSATSSEIVALLFSKNYIN